MTVDELKKKAIIDRYEFLVKENKRLENLLNKNNIEKFFEVKNQVNRDLYNLIMLHANIINDHLNGKDESAAEYVKKLIDCVKEGKTITKRETLIDKSVIDQMVADIPAVRGLEDVPGGDKIKKILEEGKVIKGDNTEVRIKSLIDVDAMIGFYSKYAFELLAKQLENSITVFRDGLPISELYDFKFEEDKESNTIPCNNGDLYIPYRLSFTSSFNKNSLGSMDIMDYANWVLNYLIDNWVIKYFIDNTIKDNIIKNPRVISVGGEDDINA